MRDRKYIQPYISFMGYEMFLLNVYYSFNQRPRATESDRDEKAFHSFRVLWSLVQTVYVFQSS